MSSSERMKLLWDRNISRLWLVTHNVPIHWVPDWIAKFMYDLCLTPDDISRYEVTYSALAILNSTSGHCRYYCEGCIRDPLQYMVNVNGVCCEACLELMMDAIVCLVFAAEAHLKPWIFTVQNGEECLICFNLRLPQGKIAALRRSPFFSFSMQRPILTPVDYTELVLMCLVEAGVDMDFDLVFKKSLMLLKHVVMNRRRVYQKLSFTLTASEIDALPAGNRHEVLMGDYFLLASAVVAATTVSIYPLAPGDYNGAFYEHLTTTLTVVFQIPPYLLDVLLGIIMCDFLSRPGDPINRRRHPTAFTSFIVP